MIATADDLISGMSALWTTAGLPVLVTGGIFDWRSIPSTVNPPAAIIKIVEGEKQTCSSNFYLQKFSVRVWIHSVNGRDDRTAMMRRTAKIDFAQKHWPRNNGLCVHVKPVAPTTDPSPLGNQARDVAITSVGWEVLMQQVR